MVKKFPEAYGLYIQQGSSWFPIQPSDKGYTISANPKILVFDSRLAQSGNPSQSITLGPLKWLRWDIKAIAAGSAATPHLYQKTKAGGFVPYGETVTMAYSPVKNQPNMLLVTPTSPIPAGYFVLHAFDVNIICNNNVTDNPDQLPDIHKVDKWSKVYDENKGFSWDAFLAQSMNGGRAVFEERIEPTQKLTSLMESFQQELSALASAKISFPMIPFCKKVERLDSDLYTLSKKQCIETVVTEMANARSDHDFPLAVAIGLSSTNAGIVDGIILKELDKSSQGLSEVEAEIAKKVNILEEDMHNPGKQLKRISFNDRRTLYEQTLFENRVTSTQDGYENHPDGWFGNIRSMGRVTRRNYSEIICLLSKGGGYGSLYLLFLNDAECVTFFSALQDAHSKWRSKFSKSLTLDIKARPSFWSERLSLGSIPYDIEPVAGTTDLLAADVSIDHGIQGVDWLRMDCGRDRPTVYGGFRYPAQFRTRSAGTNSLTFRVLLCPQSTDKELAGFKGDKGVSL